MTLIALLSSIVICSVSLAWGFLQYGLPSFSFWILVVGAGWILAAWQGWKWYSSIVLILSIIVSALGLWFGVISGWMFAGGIFAFFAWDLMEFRRRIRGMARDDAIGGIERRHLLRISLLAFFGLLFASIPMYAQAQFSFEWCVLLVVVVLFGLGQLIVPVKN